MSRGFTLVEMIVVILIMMMVMATLLPALAMMQKKADLYSANNVINVVHNVQRSYAMQFGYSGAMYGYTIRSNNTSAPGITPWVIEQSPLAVRKMSGVDIGKQMFWNSGGFVDITDNLRAVRPDAAAGLNPTSTSAQLQELGTVKDLHIAFKPRAGFATSVYGPANADPPLTLGVPFTEQETSFRLRSTRAGYRDYYMVEISEIGIIKFYAP